MSGARGTSTAVRHPDGDADRLLAGAARHCGWWLVFLGCAALAGAVAQVLLPAAIGQALDAAFRPGRTGPPGAAGSWLIRCGLLTAVIVAAGAANTLAAGTASVTATAWLRRSLVRHVLGCGPGLLGQFSTGDAVGRIIAGTADAGAAPASVVTAAMAVIPPLGSMIALGLIDPWLALAFVAGFPVLAVVLRRLMRDSTEVSVAYQRIQGDITARLLDALAGARTVAAAHSQAQECARTLGPLSALHAQGDASWRIQGRAGGYGAIIVPVIQVIVLGTAGVLLARHRITAGELVAASQYAVLAVGIGASISQLNRLGRARGGGRRAAELFAQPRTSYGAGELGPGPGRLCFSGVTVRYGDRVVLRDLSLTVPGGATVAVVGRAGAGKTTLAAVAGRLIDPDSGAVTLDGASLCGLSRDALRHAIVYAFERPALFGSTPAAAISFGAWDPAPDQVRSAATASRAAQFLARLPDGIDSPLTRTPMSGGERQRLGLARAFAHASQARLVILDDATSSLDTATEMLISEVLTGQLGDRTRLLVAHRAATAARADLVAWLDQGTLRALLPHRELWADPDYRAVFGVGPVSGVGPASEVGPVSGAGADQC